MSQRRGKRSSNTSKTTEAVVETPSDHDKDENANSIATTSTSLNKKLAPSNLLGMTPAQFCALLCISVAMTQYLDVYRSVQSGPDTSFCSRHYAHEPNVSNGSASTMESKDTISPCTTSDFVILTVKYQTTLLRIALCGVGLLICWNKEDLLRSWNFATAIAPLGTQIAVYWIHKSDLIRKDSVTFLALAFLCITSNFYDRQEKSGIHLKEGLYNIVLFVTSMFMSSVSTSMWLQGPEAYLKLNPNEDDGNVVAVTNGGKAMWSMIVGGDFATFMFLPTCALFFFDATRKRIFLFCMAIMTLAHALYQLPQNKDIWLDAPARQNASMIFFFVFLFGALFPPFQKITIKK